MLTLADVRIAVSACSPHREAEKLPVCISGSTRGDLCWKGCRQTAFWSCHPNSRCSSQDGNQNHARIQPTRSTNVRQGLYILEATSIAMGALATTVLQRLVQYRSPLLAAHSVLNHLWAITIGVISISSTSHTVQYPYLV